ncbi:hypothetical protein TNCV_5078341 [Trichonephila clavipes]|nr:hypothetical protein TNCV_5078341 [Trichonephila clavipes]
MGRVEGGGRGEFHKERNRKEIVCLAGPGASNGANISRGRPCAECDRPHAPKSNEGGGKEGQTMVQEKKSHSLHAGCWEDTTPHPRRVKVRDRIEWIVELEEWKKN